MTGNKKMSLEQALKVLNVSNLVPKEVVEKENEYTALEDSRTLEAESVLFYLETKGDQSIWRKRICKECDSKFLSSYTGVGYCSTECRKIAFEKKGMPWDPTGKTEAERWGGTIPRIIGPTATEKLEGMTFPDEPEPKKKKPSPIVDDDIEDIDDWLENL